MMLEKELSSIKDALKEQEKVNLKVSKASVGWHLDHSLKVMNSVLGSIKESNPADYKREFNGLRLFTFTVGFFPRGKVKSPKRVLPPEIIIKENIENQLNLFVKNFENFDSLDDKQFFIHPLFKQLNKKQTIKFLKLHTNHHLKIVKDILK